MLHDPKLDNSLEGLRAKVRQAAGVTPRLMAEVISRACTRQALIQDSAAAERLQKLVAAEAWTDAALAIVASEIPMWQIRRLAYEGGEWLCSLSREPNLPLSLDDTVDASHEVLPLAILSAFLDARLRIGAATARDARPQTVPQVRPLPECAVCCDNFA